jgi:hypothetical protein
MFNRETDNITDDQEQSNQISLISYQITSDNQVDRVFKSNIIVFDNRSVMS